MFRILLLFLFLNSVLVAEAAKLALTVNAEAAILMNADTGAILYEKNPYDHHYPASITKVATALLAIQKVPNDLDVMIAADQECIGTVTEDALRRSKYTMPAYLLIPDGSHIGIKRGELLSLRDLFYGLLLASGDDAANVIAKHAGGTIPQFMDELNVYVQKLGCHNTVFMNPHGLHHPNQYTCAYDMALITCESLKNPFLTEVMSAIHYKRPKTNKQEPYMLVQSNRLLRKGVYYYPKAIAGKTGYYSLASSTFVAAAKDGDRTLVAVLLKTKDRKDIFFDSKKMFEAAFSQPKVQKVLLKNGLQKFNLNLVGATQKINTFIENDVVLEYYPAEEIIVRCRVYWNEGIALPIARNQHIGELVVESNEGAVIRREPIYSVDNVNITWWHWVKTSSGILKFLCVIFVLMVAGYFMISKR